LCGNPVIELRLFMNFAAPPYSAPPRASAHSKQAAHFRHDNPHPQILGTIALLVLVGWCVADGMTVAQTRGSRTRALQAIFYVVAALDGSCRAMPISSWMARPDA